MRPITNRRKLQILCVAFVCVVIAVVVHTKQLLIPLFSALLPWGKSLIKSITPKLGLLLVKNGAVIQLRQVLMQASTHIFVKSHRPWRRKLTSLRLAATALLKKVLSRYLGTPLWLRTAIAICVLLITAGSSFAVFALLIIPQPVLNWLELRVKATLKKLGVTKLFTALWKFAIPENWRHRWHMYIKWTLGRKQVMAAKRVHQTVINTAVSSKE